VSDHAYLAAASPDRLAALIFELAAQLHAERQRRMALEELLTRRGLLDRAEIEALARDAAFLGGAQAALDTNLRRLLRILEEAGDHRAPLRGEAL
jgi:acetyl-CoA carboxylase beta subunit